MAGELVISTKDVGQKVIDRVTKLGESGMVFAKDYNYTNAIKASMLNLAEVVDKNKNPALEVCTETSVQQALFEMVTKGLDVSKKQGYFIVRGDKLCFHTSYFGNILLVRRLYPDWTPVAHVIREGDTFEYGFDPGTGKMKLIKHEQKLENIDNDFVGAYMYIPCSDGTQELYVMTKKQIQKAWAKSPSQTMQTHKDFDEKMVLKTIYNSGCQKVISSTPDPSLVPDDDDAENIHSNTQTGADFTDYEEVHDTPEIPASKNEEPAPSQAPAQAPAPAQENPQEDEF